MNFIYSTLTEGERIEQLRQILTDNYPRWEQWLTSELYSPFGTRNRKLVQHLIQLKTFKGLSKTLACSHELVDILYDHIISTLQKEETIRSYSNWTYLKKDSS